MRCSERKSIRERAGNVNGAVPMVVLALAIVAAYGAQRLSSREPPGLEVVGLGDGSRSNASE